ncbi:hypothetical protein [Caballeronia sp. LZ032]|uniref:hypothetical protein n=1 Tax=Caballeronia sp. LZ032 TaxID=3038565 RepID=UPI002863FCD8|nr:hypothetical protein [Caballeronia sp. LZ032]MDR5883651.1 hypothetical protein [Caballeronia sp. LZ032]
MGDHGNDLVIEEFGIMRNRAAQKIFDDMSVHCVIYYGVRGGREIHMGACTETDAHGDKVYTTFETERIR